MEAAVEGAGDKAWDWQTGSSPEGPGNAVTHQRINAFFPIYGPVRMLKRANKRQPVR